MAHGAIHFHIGDHALEHPIEIVLVVWHVLEIPDELACTRLEGEGGIGEQAIVVAAGNHIAHRPGVVGLRDAPQREARLGIVAAAGPDRAAMAHIVGQAIPGVAARRPAFGDRIEVPQMLARVGIESGDQPAAWALGGKADHHHAVRHKRAAVAARVLRIGNGNVPHGPARARIQRHHVQIGGGEDHLVVP